MSQQPLVVVQPFASERGPLEAAFMRMVTQLDTPASVLPYVRQAARMQCQPCERCTNQIADAFSQSAKEVQLKHAGMGAACESIDPYVALLFVLDRMESNGRPLRMLRRKRSGDCAQCAQLPPPFGVQWVMLTKMAEPRILGTSVLGWKWQFAASGDGGITVASVPTKGDSPAVAHASLRITVREVKDLPWIDLQDRFELLVTYAAVDAIMAALWSQLRAQLRDLSGSDGDQQQLRQLHDVAQLFRLEVRPNKRLRMQGGSPKERRRNVPLHEWKTSRHPILANLPNRVRIAGSWQDWANLHRELTEAL